MVLQKNAPLVKSRVNNTTLYQSNYFSDLNHKKTIFENLFSSYIFRTFYRPVRKSLRINLGKSYKLRSLL